jgi:hypothetical protein
MAVHQASACARWSFMRWGFRCAAFLIRPLLIALLKCSRYRPSPWCAFTLATNVLNQLTSFPGHSRTSPPKLKCRPSERTTSTRMSHLVFTSAGSANRQTGIPHFDSKYEVEEHIAKIGVRAIVLAPVENLHFGEWATGDTGEDGEDVVARKLVTPEVEALACEAAWVLEEANGDGPDVRDGDLRELSCRRERRGVDALRELLFAVPLKALRRA